MHFTIRKKLLIIGLVPMLVLLFFAFYIVRSVLDNYQTFADQEKNLLLLKASHVLIDSLQTERGKSAIYTQNKGIEDEIKKLRENTNQSLLNFNAQLANSTIPSQEKNSIQNILGSLEKLRLQINTSNAVSDAIVPYSSIIKNMESLLNSISNTKTGGGIGKRFSSINVLEMSKESAGLFRGFLSGLLAKNEAISDGDFFTLLTLKAGIDANLNSPALILNTKQKKAIEDLFSSPAYQTINQIFAQIIARYQQGSFNLDAVVFFSQMTEIVNKIGEIVKMGLEETQNASSSGFLRIKDNLLISLLSVFFALILVILLLWRMSRSILNPLSLLGKAIAGIAEGKGDLTQTLSIHTRDEIGTIAGNFNQFLKNMHQIIKGLKQNAENLLNAATTLSSNSEESAAGIQEITAATGSVAEHMQSEKNMILESSGKIKSMIEEIHIIHQIAEDTMKEMIEASSAIEETTSNVASISGLAQQGDKAAGNLETISQKGGKTIRQLVSSIGELGTSSSQIIEMVQLIMDISEQTNLLAMNAAIEAAHAGEFGKGFAVVAEEIRKLADRSSKSARDIEQIIREISKRIENSTKDAEETGTAFQEILSHITQVKQISHETSSSMDEQKKSIQVILESILQIKGLGEKIADKTQQETIHGKQVEESLKKLITLSEEVALAMEEEKAALSEINTASLEISRVSGQLKDISHDIKTDFNQFKTE